MQGLDAEDFVLSSLFPLHKTNVNLTDSNIYSGTTFSSVFGRIFDWIILDRINMNQSPRNHGLASEIDTLHRCVLWF